MMVAMTTTSTARTTAPITGPSPARTPALRSVPGRASAWAACSTASTSSLADGPRAAMASAVGLADVVVAELGPLEQPGEPHRVGGAAARPPG